MEALRTYLGHADTNAVAIGHFNISDLVGLKAVFAAALDLKLPVVVGVSEGEREFMGTRQVAAVVKSLRDEHDVPLGSASDIPDFTFYQNLGANSLQGFDGSQLTLRGTLPKVR